MGDLYFWCLVMVLMAVGVGVVKAWVVAWWRPRKIAAHFARQGIRGPRYIPFLGNIKEMVSLMLHATATPMPLSHNIVPRVLSFYHHWKKIYGRTFVIWFGVTPRLTVADPDLIGEILVSKSELYEKNETHPLILQLEGEGLLSLEGQKWAHHRRIINPTFHLENLKAMIPEIGQIAVEMAERWEKEALASDYGEKEVDVAECFQELTEDVITRAGFGASYEEGKCVFHLQTQQMFLAAEAFHRVFLPGYRFVPTKRNLRRWRLDKNIQRSLIDLICRRKARPPNGFGRSGDLLSKLIAASESSAAVGVSVQDIVEECKTFFFAGKQTTSNLLTWTTVLLAMHPDWQGRARAEVIRHCGEGDVPTRDAVAKLKTVSMILNESLRLYPPVVAMIRRTKSDVVLGSGYRIPAGMELLIPILAVHHDPRLWGDDASQFNPARFREGVGRAAKHPMSFMPFGFGPRTCVGRNLALLEARLVLAVLLRRFSFRLSPSYTHAPAVLMLLYPKHGAPVSFTPLRRSNWEDQNYTGDRLCARSET